MTARPFSTRQRPGRARGLTPGFTLVEVLVAMSVVMVGLLGITGIFFSGHFNISQSGRDTAAVVVAQSLAENMRNQPQAELPQLNGMNTDDPANCPGAPGSRVNLLCADWISQVQVLPEGRGTVAVTQTPNPTTGIMLNRITVTVTWTEASRGGQRQLSLVLGRSD